VTIHGGWASMAHVEPGPTATSRVNAIVSFPGRSSDPTGIWPSKVIEPSRLPGPRVRARSKVRVTTKPSDSIPVAMTLAGSG
jgi:hypothetical protein